MSCHSCDRFIHVRVAKLNAVRARVAHWQSSSLQTHLSLAQSPDEYFLNFVDYYQISLCHFLESLIFAHIFYYTEHYAIF